MRNGVDFPDGSFDGIIAPDLLERVPRPERILRRIRRWLAPEGRLITAFSSARSVAVVEGLLAGRWLATEGYSEERRPIRFFTRREVEKLLYRTGYAADFIEAIPDPRYAERVLQNRPGRIRVGQLSLSGLPAHDVEEFCSGASSWKPLHCPLRASA